MDVALIARNARTRKRSRSRWLSTLEMTARGSKKTVDTGSADFSRDGLSVRRLNLNSDGDYSFDWRGHSHYVALHDLNHLEGETFTDDKPVDRQNDLRGRLTFIPAGCRVWGWAIPVKQAQSVTALYVDPHQIESELAQRLKRLPDSSRLYFTDASLGATLRKLHFLLGESAPVDPMYMESLCLVGALELSFLGSQQHADAIRPTGSLAKRIERRIVDYIDSNLDRDIGLDELATLAGLSRFHFSRAFKSTTLSSPYHFLLRRRIERAAILLQQSSMSIAEVSTAVGFKDSTRFIRTFRGLHGITPGQFRRNSTGRD
jgi:AraC family transcriptional regulator